MGQTSDMTALLGEIVGHVPRSARIWKGQRCCAPGHSRTNGVSNCRMLDIIETSAVVPGSWLMKYDAEQEGSRTPLMTPIRAARVRRAI